MAGDHGLVPGPELPLSNLLCGVTLHITLPDEHPTLLRNPMTGSKWKDWYSAPVTRVGDQRYLVKWASLWALQIMERAN
jgi:hypothetical protein